MDLPQNSKTEQFITSGPYTGWQLIKAFWQSNQRFMAYVSFSVIMLMTVIIVGFDLVFNFWYKHFYDALQAYNMHDTVRLLGFFCILAFFWIVLQVYRFYISQLFGLRWRRWLTEQFIGRWLQKRGYYYLETFDVKTDNPDQRIQEDAGALTTQSIDLVTGLVSSVTTFFAFIYVLWGLSGVMHLSLGQYGTLSIPGYLVWVSILYALVGTLFTFKLGRPLIALNFEQQRREATFRYAAIDLRSHAEEVALYSGEQHQKSILQRLFSSVLENWLFIILRQKLLLWYTSGYNQVSVLLPLVVALPNYFDKVFLLGGLIQSLQAFSRVQDSLSFIVNSYTQIAQWQAISQRLTTFVNHLTEVEDKAEKEDHVVFHQHPENTILTEHVTIKTPRAETLLQNINETFVHGQHYVIKGESGIGKSTLVRAIAGIWPYAEGEITLPANKQLMYLPQIPYMPIGTLAEAIMFPDHVNVEQESALAATLRDCRLENIIPRLHETASWTEQFSPGEQQRIAFARVLLHKPDWVFMDESTSMLDLANEEYLYKLLKERLPHCSIVSVGHRPSLDNFHDHVIDIAKYSSYSRDDKSAVPSPL